MSNHRIEIDRDLCSGFGACADLDPESFALGGDGSPSPSWRSPIARQP